MLIKMRKLKKKMRCQHNFFVHVVRTNISGGIQTMLSACLVLYLDTKISYDTFYLAKRYADQVTICKLASSSTGILFRHQICIQNLVEDVYIFVF